MVGSAVPHERPEVSARAIPASNSHICDDKPLFLNFLLRILRYLERSLSYGFFY